MSGSHRYLAPLEAIRELFVHYPVNADLSSIHIAADPSGQSSILVRLLKADPVVLAAGVVEWRRTLARGNTWAWRAADGEGVHVATTGYAPECNEIPITVVAGPVPPDCYLELDLDLPEELGDNTLYHWLGNEIANNWPFRPPLVTAGTSPHRSPPAGTEGPHPGDSL